MERKRFSVYAIQKAQWLNQATPAEATAQKYALARGKKRTLAATIFLWHFFRWVERREWRQ